MTFSTTKYQTNGGDIFFIRLSADIKVLAGVAPTGTPTTNLFVKVSKTGREFGLRPRYALYAQSIVSGTHNFKVYLKIPKLTETALAASPATQTYKGEDYDLVRLVGEDT